MPQGNAHELPSGIWYQTPAPDNYKYMATRAALRWSGVVALFFAVNGYRSILWNYSMTNFIGKTLSLRNMSTLTHEPLSPDEVDRLNAERASRKRK